MAEQITKDLGGITAYAAAVAAGYTGTKAQFETLMASYATVAQNAAASASAAADSEENAEAWAVGERSGTPVSSGDDTYNNNAKYYAEEAEAYADSIDPDTLAKIDGYYQEMTVGDAEQIVSSILVEDKVPYQFRTAGGSVDIGKRAYFDAIVGGTVAWNQLSSALDVTHWTSSSAGTSNVQFADGVASFLATVQYNGISLVSDYRPPALKDHKYFFTATAKAGSTADLQARSFGGYGDINFTVSTSWTTASRVFNLPEEVSLSSRAILLRDKRANGWDTVSWKNIQLIDLTLLFGSTIADYIHSLEQATAGAGVAFFRKYFPNSYYPYSAGVLVSVSGLSAHKTTGFNQWDEEWEQGGINSSSGANATDSNRIRSKNYIPIVSGSTYYIKAPQSLTGFYYDENKAFIGYAPVGYDTTLVPVSNARYLRFTIGSSSAPVTTYGNNICINLSWDGSRDGEYEEYVEHSYPLDDSLTLRGIPKLDASNKLYFDGDEYEADGTVTRRWKPEIDLGSIEWESRETTAEGLFVGIVPSDYLYASTVKAICSKYDYKGIIGATANAPTILGDKGCGLYYAISVPAYTYPLLYVYDTALTGKTGAQVKELMSGQKFTYELATPTTEEADPYSGIQIVDDFGTEEFITDSVVPVGHVTHYPVNLVAKLEMMPNSPDGNGDYIVQQDSGINTYIPLASTDTITGIIARLEALEQAAGIGGE